MAVERNVSPGDIESIVCRLKGIIAVSVVPDVVGDVAEVHVLASSTGHRNKSSGMWNPRSWHVWGGYRPQEN